jgi:hypothetical protein
MQRERKPRLNDGIAQPLTFQAALAVAAVGLGADQHVWQLRKADTGRRTSPAGSANTAGERHSDIPQQLKREMQWRFRCGCIIVIIKQHTLVEAFASAPRRHPTAAACSPHDLEPRNGPVQSFPHAHVWGTLVAMLLPRIQLTTEVAWHSAAMHCGM